MQYTEPGGTEVGWNSADTVTVVVKEGDRVAQLVLERVCLLRCIVQNRS